MAENMAFISYRLACLCKTLFVIMAILLQLQPQDDPVYQFLGKERSEDKKYYVCMTAVQICTR